MPETGVAKYLQGSVGNIGSSRACARPYLIWHLRLGHLSAPMGALGGDDAPACATNSFEQDNFAEVILLDRFWAKGPLPGPFVSAGTPSKDTTGNQAGLPVIGYESFGASVGAPYNNSA